MPIKIDRRWKDLALRELVDNPDLGPAALIKVLEAKGQIEGLKIEEVPSERTAARWRREAQHLTDDAKERYRSFRWPDAMQSGALPWEASAAIFELMATIPARAPDGAMRPPITAIRWYWRVTQAAPDAPVHMRWQLGRDIAARESVGAAIDGHAITLFLSRQPWRTAEARIQYEEEAAARGVFAINPDDPGFGAIESANVEASLRAGEEFTGISYTPRQRASVGDAIEHGLAPRDQDEGAVQ